MMTTKNTISSRQRIAESVSSFVESHQLNTVYSGSGVSANKKYRFVLLSIPRVLDGSVNIYSSKFIQVKYETAYQGLPHRDSRVFVSVDAVIEFLRLAFVERKFDEALDVQTKSATTC